MGTNYYLYIKPACPECGRNNEPLHIGKSAYGWCFALHVMPEEGINDLDDWKALWEKPGANIKDEYGDPITTDEMEKIITQREGIIQWDSRKWIGYGSELHFHTANHSDRGPNGLLRDRLGDHCIKHGAGTWDCIIGEFS